MPLPQRAMESTARRHGCWTTGDKKIYAYDLTPGSTFGDRDSGQDIALDSDNGNPRAIWSNGGTMWVTDLRQTTSCTPTS